MNPDAGPTSAAPLRGRLSAYGAERRIQIFAIVALFATVVLAAAISGFAGGTLFGFAIPSFVVVSSLALALLVGVVAVVRRTMGLVGAAIAFAAFAVLPAGEWEATTGALVLGLLFALAVLAYVELAHQAARYDRLRALVEAAHTSAAGLDHAVREYVKTLARALLWTALAGLVIWGLFALVRTAGPAQLVASRDFASVLGFEMVALLVLAAAALVGISRGADLTIPRSSRAAARSDSSESVVDDEN